MRAARASALIASVVTLGTSGSAAQSAPAPRLGSAFQGFLWDGGSADDHGFAEMASGLEPGKSYPDLQFDLVLEAIRATDRFQSVAGTLGADGIARIRLQPWPPLRSWDWRGDALPKKTRLLLFPDLKKGMPLGNIRLEEWRRVAEAQLRNEGYPEAKLATQRDATGAGLSLTVALGHANLIKGVEVAGDLGPYRLETLLKIAGIQPGRTLWTQD